MKKNNGKRNVQFLAAAALTATLMAGQVQPSAVYGSETIQVSSLIPDNVTVEQPVPLSEISLPSSEYGILSWADESSVPSERVQSYDVVFRPYNQADLSKISGWDGSSDVIYSSVTVVVSGIEENESQEEEWSEDQDDSQWEEENSGTEENDSQESEDQNTGSEGEDTGESDSNGQENEGFQQNSGGDSADEDNNNSNGNQQSEEESQQNSDSTEENGNQESEDQNAGSKDEDTGESNGKIRIIFLNRKIRKTSVRQIWKKILQKKKRKSWLLQIIPATGFLCLESICHGMFSSEQPAERITSLQMKTRPICLNPMNLSFGI